MQQFLILFREPDGRKDTHSPAAVAQHRGNWDTWLNKMTTEKRLAGGMPLTLNGKIVKGNERLISNGPHTVGEEIVGGYLLINAVNLEEATTLIQSCPIFEFGGYAEVREIMAP